MKHCGVNAAPGSGDGHGGDRACAVEGVSVPVITGAPVPGPDRVWARKQAEDDADRTAGVRNVLDNTNFTPSPPQLPVHTTGPGVVGRRLRQELRAAQRRVLLGPAAPETPAVLLASVVSASGHPSQQLTDTTAIPYYQYYLVRLGG